MCIDLLFLHLIAQDEVVRQVVYQLLAKLLVAGIIKSDHLSDVFPFLATYNEDVTAYPAGYPHVPTGWDGVFLTAREKVHVFTGSHHSHPHWLRPLGLLGGEQFIGHVWLVHHGVDYVRMGLLPYGKHLDIGGRNLDRFPVPLGNAVTQLPMTQAVTKQAAIIIIGFIVSRYVLFHSIHSSFQLNALVCFYLPMMVSHYMIQYFLLISIILEVMGGKIIPFPMNGGIIDWNAKFPYTIVKIQQIFFTYIIIET